MDLPHFVKKLQQPNYSQEDGSIRCSLDLDCFSSFLSALLLMISLSLANLISQQYLVFVCLSAGPLFNYLLTHPSADFL